MPMQGRHKTIIEPTLCRGKNSVCSLSHLVLVKPEMIYTFLISISAIKILRYIDIVTSFDSYVSWLSVELLNFKVSQKIKILKELLKINTKCTYVPTFSLCNFSNKAVEMQTMKNVGQKCP